jgi:hypothetical protein
LVFKPLGAYRHLASLNSDNKAKDKLKILALSILAWTKGLTSRFDEAAREYKQVPHSEKDQLINTYYAGKPWFFLHQNNRYNHWRLTLNPFGNDYRNIAFTSNGQSYADAIINIRKDVSYVEQLLASATVADVDLRKVINALIVKLRASNTPLIRILCFTNSEEGNRQIRILKKCGFTYLDRGNYFVWKSLAENETLQVENLILSRLFTQGNL